MEDYRLSHLDILESESIYIFREVASEFENPVLLYSIGKDSSVMLRLAQKAFYPGKIPFPILHVDTGYKFEEMIEFRDNIAKKADLRLNEIGRVIIKTQKPLLFDIYSKNRSTGSFIIIDELTNNTVSAGIIWYSSENRSHDLET